MKEPTRIYFVVPCYREEKILPDTLRRLVKKMYGLIEGGKAAEDSRILFVDDGSDDSTWEIIERAYRKETLVEGLLLTRNWGHQNALMAGILEAEGKADAVITMDADLQDDIEAIDKMLEAYENGAEVVYGVRKSRKTDTLLKRLSAEAFYELANWLGCHLIPNHAEFRLMGSKVLKELKGYREVNLFLRGVLPSMGHRTAIVEYERKARRAGESKYSVSKMMSLAFEGITSFSMRPLRLILVVGLAILSMSAGKWIYGELSRDKEGRRKSLTNWLSCGMQMTALGIVGEYTGKDYLESKRRPRYLVEKELMEGMLEERPEEGMMEVDKKYEG